MYLDRNISQYVINEEASLLEALVKLDDRKGRILVVVRTQNIVSGIITNGDILRWLIANKEPNLNTPLMSVANSTFIQVHADESDEEISRLLKKVAFVPVIDSKGHLIAVARRDTPAEGIKIGDRIVGDDSSCFVIAEIGNNHNGDIDLAKHLVDECVRVGADCAKFQMRNLDELYINKGDANDISENLGSQYTLDLLSRFQLTNEQLIEVFDYCKSKGIIPLCTPWDLSSLAVLEEYGMLAYKVASADFTNHELIGAIAATGKPLICSTGMSSQLEIEKTVEYLSKLGATFILLHCNSTYPAPLQDINLKYLSLMKEKFKTIVGYSGHERGINVSIAAVALGAKVIERHITLDRSMEGNDHKASLLPGEFHKMIKGIREVEESLGSGGERALSQGELMNRVNLAKSIVAKVPIAKGIRISKDMVEIKSPGKGLQPIYMDKLIGTDAKKDFTVGDFFYPSDISDDRTESREYEFKRPWGIPVRYHDYGDLVSSTNPDFVEFHLSYKDLELDINQFFDKKLPFGFVVHCPELFANDHTLDLTSLDTDYRNRSIKELRRVIEVTKALSQFFDQENKPMIVTNVGGFTDNGFLSAEERHQRYEILVDSLAKIDTTGIEILPQTMPPFPWHFGGQQYHNLFVDPDEIAEFCEKHNYRICLDTSHSKLACAHYGYSFYEFLEKTAKYSAHNHIADSEGTGGEGLQIGTGELDFPMMADQLNTYSPDSWFIPEIWQGHENNGEGFWIALEKLEKYFQS
jgi:sialic acid synthase SpsE/sugar phosphate isomerase/epimerase